MHKIIIFILTILIILHFNKNKTEQTPSWYQCPTTNNKLNRLFKNELNKNKIYEGTDRRWHIYLPCESTNKEMQELSLNNTNQKIYMIHNNHLFTSKKNLWVHLLRYFGRDKAITIMPKTYVLPYDTGLLKREFDPKKIYIMKKELQRQEGLKLTNDYRTLVNSVKDKYVVIQEFEKNPLLIQGHKINVRVYFVVICRYGKLSAYVFDDGIITYTKKRFQEGSTDFDKVIASFYQNKELFAKGMPITTKELTVYLQKKSRNKFKKCIDKTSEQLSDVIQSVKNRLCSNNKYYYNTTFQLFGADFFVDHQYEPKLLEINKGPGMEPFNTIDEKMRTTLQQHILDIVQIVDLPKNKVSRFTRL